MRTTFKERPLFGIVVEKLLGMLMSHTGLSGSVHVTANVHPWRQQIMTKCSWIYATTMEITDGVPVPDFNLAQSWLLQAFKECTNYSIPPPQIK